MGARTLEVRNPVDGTPLATLPEADAGAVFAAVARARAAQPGWAALPVRERGRQLRRLARRMATDETLLDTLIAESGKPRFECELIELLYTAELARFMAGRAVRKALTDSRRGHFFFLQKRSRVVRRPRGVVGVIGPYNWPVLNNFADALAPLIAGNAVVLKPSPITPLSSLRIAELWREEGLPEAVFQVVVGGADTGAALVDAVDMIFFTGSAEAGRRIAARAGERLIPAALELGGKNPMLVLADADLDEAVQAALWGGFVHSGEACVSIERVLVEAPIADAFVQKLAARVAELRVGAPSKDETQDPDLGAVTMPGRVAKLERLVEDAVAAGAHLVAGGHAVTAPGAPAPSFLQPTILDHVRPDMAIAREETFGPVLSIMRVASADEALAVANALPVGLSGSVMSRDGGRARALAKRLNIGSVCINDALVHYFCVEAPLGGYGQSGLGLRHGPESALQFTWPETIVEDRPLLRPIARLVKRLLPFPHRPAVARALRFWLRRFYG